MSRTLKRMLYMMNFADVREEDEQYRSPLDMLFRALEEEQPNHVAVKQYKVFKQAAGKTAKSILGKRPPCGWPPSISRSTPAMTIGG